MTTPSQRILILDFGSQYTQLIARRVREIGVYCEIHPYKVSDKFIQEFAPQGIILSGGPASVLEKKSPRAPDIVFTLGCPVLGICYGMQTMSAQLGGQVSVGTKREFGYAQVKIPYAGRLLQDIEDKMDGPDVVLDVWMSHGDHVSVLPESFQIIASTKDCPAVGIADETRHFYGLQFHPEVTHTHQGKRILERFILGICQCQRNWTTSRIVDDLVQDIKAQVQKDHVILGLSGGVDSSTLAALLHKAIGKQLTCIFVDTGLLRLNEAEQVKDLFAEHLGIHLVIVKAEERFLAALKGVRNPEQKRKIIGNLFVQIFEEESQKIKNVVWLSQGTIYSDVIESAGASGKAQVIKTHHNVGGLPKVMRLKLLEPLRELFKDEVRKVGLELGLPYELVYRHPFPGPGLSIRVLGEVKKEALDKLRLADAIFIEELHKAGLYHKVSQAFTVFLSVKSVGVIGDCRHYDDVIALRAVETTDFMTAHWAHLSHEFLGNVSNRIVNEVKGISRVVYDITGKPPATIEWE
ncbi:MAG TPA: glutamine-hydrolyzing GMP synthase [Gammaproteobacteria bacterium]|nr:glutamine-hydrolyzing GMP synthase [Gammaproteobacteria bacterium]